jgi:MFS family permease
MTRKLRLAADNTFRSLHTRNFRLFFVGQLVSQAGTWMEAVAITWVVLQLTDSGIALGLVTAARFGPLLVLGPWGGVLSDRLDRLRLMLVTQVCFAALATLLMVLIVGDYATVPVLYLLCIAFGVLTALDSPARRALVTELVPDDHVSNAVGLNSAIMTGARVIGPALAGAVIAGPGVEWCFVANSVSYLVIIGSLLRLDRSKLRATPRIAKAKGQLREGFRYVVRTPELALPMAFVTVVGTLAFNFQVTLPLLAERSLHGDASTFTWIYATMSLGSVFGALAVAHRQRLHAGFLVGAGTGMAVAMTALALAPNVPLALAAALPTGFTSIFMISGINAVVQLDAAPEMRGRVLALVSMVFLGSTPIGGPLVGWVSQTVDPRAGLLVGSIATGLASAWAAHRFRALKLDNPKPIPTEAEPAPATAA